MKNKLLAVALFIVAIALWFQAEFWKYDRNNYLSEKVLEISRPFNVKIDLEFLKKLDPAYE